ncbi:lipopolysaccharide kinase InaA family protein [Selenihalanaerobacter shriftii]|uniref:Lipopolysaccharide kinase (Kdo/WaaP) family protein n=1 Tax=Selenihalanaerobacter shriftii TaxID=142842 RepID=A0A1T4KW85_9FIRM|nr:lipopolysaccharide kinase InaA family protein [Selenihalanaerobacter shriftii]SJZ46689.1 Lipopolysaccharide kinase (Kdo/WaaP) family protein [Selenihalanaerobacter shriftii]
MITLNLHNEKFNSKIKVHYTGEIKRELCEKLIDYFWLNNSSEFKDEIKLVKESKRRGIKVFRLSYNNQNYYLKKNSHTRISKKIQIFLRGPEGVRNLKNVNKLLQANISTAKPLFALTKRNLVSHDSIFITEKADGIGLNEYIRFGNLNNNERIIQSLGRLWAKLINNNFSHQDPALDNFFININKEKVKWTLIDLDDIYSMPFLPKIVVMHTLARFIAKIYIFSFKYDISLFKGRELILFLKEFYRNYNRNFGFEKLVNKIEKLVINKIIKRDKKDMILSDESLIGIYNKYK